MAATPRPSETLRTVAELETLGHLYADTHDVYVEGRDDRRFIESFFRYAGVNPSVTVYAVSDRVWIPATDLFDRGLEDGNRSRLIFLASGAAIWLDEYLTCVIDADYEHTLKSLPYRGPNLLLTDGYSMESYALNQRTVDKLLALSLRRDDDAGEVLRAIDSPLREMRIARQVLHQSDLGSGLADNPLRKYRGFDSLATLRAEELVQKAVPSPTRGDLEALVIRCSIVREEMAGPIMQVARGHDISLVLKCGLQLSAPWDNAAVIEGALVGNLDYSELESKPMFVKLLARVA